MLLLWIPNTKSWTRWTCYCFRTLHTLESLTMPLYSLLWAIFTSSYLLKSKWKFVQNTLIWSDFAAGWLRLFHWQKIRNHRTDNICGWNVTRDSQYCVVLLLFCKGLALTLKMFVVHLRIHFMCVSVFSLIRCPKTVENFCVHSRNGYYNGNIVHRVIKGFMIQMGDPLG